MSIQRRVENSSTISLQIKFYFDEHVTQAVADGPTSARMVTVDSEIEAMSSHGGRNWKFNGAIAARLSDEAAEQRSPQYCLSMAVAEIEPVPMLRPL